MSEAEIPLLRGTELKPSVVGGILRRFLAEIPLLRGTELKQLHRNRVTR